MRLASSARAKECVGGWVRNAVGLCKRPLTYNVSHSSRSRRTSLVSITPYFASWCRCRECNKERERESECVCVCVSVCVCVRVCERWGSECEKETFVDRETGCTHIHTHHTDIHRGIHAQTYTPGHQGPQMDGSRCKHQCAVECVRFSRHQGFLQEQGNGMGSWPGSQSERPLHHRRQQ